jgi:chemotaxis protein MotB
MRRQSHGGPTTPFVVLADVALTMLFILIFTIMTQALSGSNALRRARLERAQHAVAVDVQRKFRREIHRRVVRVPRPDGNLQRVSFADRVLFDSGDDLLKPTGRALLVRLAAVLRSHQSSYRSIRVEGHTDDQPIRTVRFPSNWELSSARATSVVRLFQACGIPAKRLTAAGRGEFHPVGSNETALGRALNRRIEIVLEYSEESK